MIEFDQENLDRHWNKTKRLVWSLFTVWATVSFVPPIFAPSLNKIVIIGFPLGYWLSAQVALITFVVLLYINAVESEKIDREFDLHEED